MEMRWYGIGMECKQCRTELMIAQFSYSSDGELRFEYLCPKCRMEFEYRVFASRLALIALSKDIEKMGIIVPNTPLVPPTKKPNKITDKDKKWLNDLGIAGEDNT